MQCWTWQLLFSWRAFGKNFLCLLGKAWDVFASCRISVWLAVSGGGRLSGSESRELKVESVGSRAREKVRLRVFVFPQIHGGRWETFFVFAYCGLVGNPHLTAKILDLAPLPTSTKDRGSNFK